MLGLLINFKADWSEHVDLIYKKSCKKLYVLRKLRTFGFSILQLTKMYVTHIRSILEYCCVVWAYSLTINQIKKLVSVEKRALSIIIGKYVSSSNYLSTCEFVKISSLNERWKILLENFGIKMIRNERFKHWLQKFIISRSEGHNNRNNKNKFNLRAVPTKSERYRKSKIPSLIRERVNNSCIN